MLKNELEIKRLAKKYKFKKCEVFSNELYIESQKGSWNVRCGGKKGLELWHINENNLKTRWHKQRDYYDIPFMFESIANHDKFKLKDRYTKPCRMTMLFNQISVK